MMDSRLWYGGLILLVVGERLVELGLSRRHGASALTAGGVEHGADHYPWMVLLNAGLLRTRIRVEEAALAAARPARVGETARGGFGG